MALRRAEAPEHLGFGFVLEYSSRAIFRQNALTAVFGATPDHGARPSAARRSVASVT